jgi:cation-transporting P-type ATPase C
VAKQLILLTGDAPETAQVVTDALGFVAGAGGSINPVVAALLHNTSSIAVVGNSARLVNHTPHLPRATDDQVTAAPLEDRRVR